jgi:uncharacterized membrane protein
VLKVAVMGGLFGFATLHRLTALAVIKSRQSLTFVDMAWGTMVSGVSLQQRASWPWTLKPEDVKKPPPELV